MKAEKILENQKDRINLSQLDVIKEETGGDKLTSHALKNLEQDGPTEQVTQREQRSLVSNTKSKKKDLFEN